MKKIIIISFLSLFIRLNEGYTTSPKFEDLSIILISCDKYSELWDPFFKILFQKWPSLMTSNKQLPIYLVGNHKTYDDNRIQNISIPNEISWSDNAIEALKQVKTKYVLVLLEDYFLTHLDEQRLFDLFELMKKDNIAYMQLSGDHAHVPNNPIEDRKIYNKNFNVISKGRYEKVRTSLEACIWRKVDFQHILKKGENPWQFEIAGSIRSEGTFNQYLSVLDNNVISYLNMARTGYINSKGLKQINDGGYNWQPTSLPIDENHKILLWYRFKLKVFLYESIWLPIESMLRKIL